MVTGTTLVEASWAVTIGAVSSEAVSPKDGTNGADDDVLE